MFEKFTKKERKKPAKEKASRPEPEAPAAIQKKNVDGEDQNRPGIGGAIIRRRMRLRK